MIRKKYKFCYIYPPLSDKMTFEEILAWKKEIELLWKGYRVEWKQIENRRFGIICTEKEEKLTIN